MKNKNICVVTSSTTETIEVINLLLQRGAKIDGKQSLEIFWLGNCVEVDRGFIYTRMASNFPKVFKRELAGMYWFDLHKDIVTNLIAPSTKGTPSVFISYRKEQDPQLCGLGETKAESVKNLLKNEEKFCK